VSRQKAQHSLALRFDERALAEWRKLDGQIRREFKKKLAKLVAGEEAPSPRTSISGLGPGYYKIKQRASGYRLVYRYEEKELVILVIAIGKRNRSAVYDIARRRTVKDE
jgi:mRNA interferase RelE/StbE